jgi:hypothetical protein
MILLYRDRVKMFGSHWVNRALVVDKPFKKYQVYSAIPMFCVTVVEKEDEGAKGSENENENGDQVSEKIETTEGIVLTSITVMNGLVTVHIIYNAVQ